MLKSKQNPAMGFQGGKQPRMSEGQMDSHEVDVQKVTYHEQLFPGQFQEMEAINMT